VAWLADRCGRLRVLLGCYGLVVLGLVALPLAGASLWLPLWLFVVGACSGAFYPLGLALLGERLPDTQLARANAWYLSLECLGSLMGPALMGLARDWSGETAMFAVGEAAVLLVLVGGLLQARRPSGARADVAGVAQRSAA
jgi:MFS family permease